MKWVIMVLQTEMSGALKMGVDEGKSWLLDMVQPLISIPSGSEAAAAAAEATELQLPPSALTSPVPVTAISRPASPSMSPRAIPILSVECRHPPFFTPPAAAPDRLSAAASVCFEGLQANDIDDLDRAHVLQLEDTFPANPAAAPAVAVAALTSPPLPSLASDSGPSLPHQSPCESSKIIASAILQSLVDSIVAQSACSLTPSVTAPSFSDIPRPKQRARELTSRPHALLTAFISSQSDPVLKSHLEDIICEAVPVMKHVDGLQGWQDGYMAARGGSLFFADTYKAVKRISDSEVQSATDDVLGGHGCMCLDLMGCSVRKSPAETDKAHFAFVLATSEVHLLHACAALVTCSRRHAGSRAAVVHQRRGAQSSLDGNYQP